ncbi:MAG TPA: TRZ/ATZ family hydrolase [Burkholderiales bacterium]|nr:TRZ/ATZ family hydrolase [Burkholderiales bacterium]
MAEATLILPRWVVPIEPHGVVLEHHAVLLRGARIEALLPAAEARARFADARSVELPGHVLIPGLVNAHTHAAMTLMRGLADDLPLMRWLTEHIWPVEMRHVTPEFVRDGTLLACAEMLRGGITCFNDMYFYPEAALQAASTAGMRAALGMIVVDFPTAYASDPDDYLQKGLALRDRYRDDPLASFCLAPHAPYTVSDEALHKVAMLAGELDVPVHIHVHETEDEVARSVAEHGARPLERLRRLGLLGPNFMAVHAVHLSDDDILLLLRHNASVVHCPSSNLKLASGFAPIARIAGDGVNIALGTDGAASNNRLDLLGEMRLAALLGKAVARNAEAIPAHSALRAATLGGAAALGLEPKIGSIVPGKEADLTAVDLSAPELSPCYDPVSHLVYAAGREHVSHVWVRGRLILEDGAFSGSLTTGLESRLELWQNFIKPGPGR